MKNRLPHPKVLDKLAEELEAEGISCRRLAEVVHTIADALRVLEEEQIKCLGRI